MVCTSICAAMSMVMLILCVSSEHWLHTKERCNLPTGLRDSYNQTLDDVFLLTEFGLWKRCTQFIGKVVELVEH